MIVSKSTFKALDLGYTLVEIKEEKRGKNMYQQISYTKSTNKAQPVRITSEVAIYANDGARDFIWDMSECPSKTLSKNGETYTRLAVKQASETSYKIDYARRGAKNHGVVTVKVTNQEGEVASDVLWIVLRGYTGNQMRTFYGGRKAETVFALAGEDAFMFCTADPCLECNFACLVGIEIYAYSKSQGLIMDGFKKILR